VFETLSSELGVDKQDIIDNISCIEYAKATKQICFTPREEFEKEHALFRELGIKYINFSETEQTMLLGLYPADIVQQESRVLPETENYFIEKKYHSNLQKFHPDKLDQEGYDILVNFIKDKLRLI
jgi:hypothetical protein